jgi:uncharacterized protein YqgC (DUF456 family)
MRTGIYILMVLAAIMIAVIVTAAGYPYLRAKMAYLVIGGFALLLIVIQLIKELRTTSPKKEGFGDKLPTYGVEIGWLIGLFVGVYLFGFIISPLLFATGYLKTHGLGWFRSILVAVILAGVVYLLFIYLLEMDLAPGLILELADYNFW